MRVVLPGPLCQDCASGIVDEYGPKSPDSHRVVWGLTSRPAGSPAGFPPVSRLPAGFVPFARGALAGHSGDRWRVECTGFGLNLVSGNFEFASLIVITDEQWWVRFGGSIQANWESAGLRCYSSLDRDLLAQLCHDPAWSNEGLFALLQGFRRLAVIDEGRVNLPTIDLEV